MSLRPAIVWFRQDLRLDDNPALTAAAAGGRPVIPLFIHTPGEEGDWVPGTASNVWLRQSLEALDSSLKGKGSRLVVREGTSLDQLEDIIRETGAAADSSKPQRRRSRE